MIKNFQPKDVVALLIIVGYIIYSLLNHNSMVPATVMLIVGYYFARKDEVDHTVPPPSAGISPTL